MKLLHLDSSILGDRSVSRAITAAIVDRFKQANPEIEVTYRDLVANPPAHMTLATLPRDHPSSALAGPLDLQAQTVREESDEILEEFMAADIVVIGAPMYNFAIATQLKAWIDVIVVPGRTFAYGPTSVVGFVGSKRVILAISRGSTYGSEGSAFQTEYAESYLRMVLSFLGIDHPEVVTAEGTAFDPEVRNASLNAALEKARAIAA